MFLRVFVNGGLSSYYIINVSKTIINHPFGNGKHPTYWSWFGRWCKWHCFTHITHQQGPLLWFLSDFTDIRLAQWWQSTPWNPGEKTPVTEVTTSSHNFLFGACLILPFIRIHLGIIIIPTDELIFFRGVGWNHQPKNMDNGWFWLIGFLGILPTIVRIYCNEDITSKIWGLAMKSRGITNNTHETVIDVARLSDSWFVSKPQKTLRFLGIYPLVICYSLLLKMTIEIVEFPIEIVEFPIEIVEFPIEIVEFPIENGDFPIRFL